MTSLSYGTRIAAIILKMGRFGVPLAPTPLNPIRLQENLGQTNATANDAIGKRGNC